MSKDTMPRRITASALIEMGGSSESPNGFATKPLLEAAIAEGYKHNNLAFLQLLRGMERDGEITRETKSTRTYAIRMTEYGRAKYGFEEKLEPKPESEQEQEQGQEPPPGHQRPNLVARVYLSEGADSFDYKALATAVRDLLESEVPDDVKENLAKALAESERLRGKIRGLEQQVADLSGTVERQRREIRETRAKRQDRVSVAAELDQLLAVVKKTHGWEVETAANSHFKVTAPSGRKIVLAATGSDYRGMKNARAELRREGLPV